MAYLEQEIVGDSTTTMVQLRSSGQAPRSPSLDHTIYYQLQTASVANHQSDVSGSKSLRMGLYTDRKPPKNPHRIRCQSYWSTWGMWGLKQAWLCPASQVSSKSSLAPHMAGAGQTAFSVFQSSVNLRMNTTHPR